VDAEAPGSLAHPSADFEQSRTQSFDLGQAPRLRKLEQTKQVDQIVGEAMQEQTEGVGQKTMSAEPVGVEAVFELFDAVLALAAIVVEGKDLGSTAGTVGDEEAQIGSRGRVCWIRHEWGCRPAGCLQVCGFLEVISLNNGRR
jgi:hypothetical protein